MPYLLGLLASIVLIFFVTAEKKLRDNLSQTNTYDVYLTEQVSGSRAPIIASQSFEEEQMWKNQFPSGDITYIRQSFSAAQIKDNKQHTSILIYGDSAEELQQLRDDIQAPTVWLLTTQPEQYDTHAYVNVRETTVLAKTRKMPEKIHKVLHTPSAIAIPISMAEAVLKGGFVVHLLGEFNNLQEVKQFELHTSAFYKAESRRPRTFSAIGILESLEQMQRAQTYIRVSIVAGCGIILALILGTIAWLEHRQEAYLLALLRSFGTPRFVLLAHSFLENLLLVTAGIIAALYSWKPLYSLLSSSAPSLQLSATPQVGLPTADASIILIAGALGVLTAMIPVAFGLRKPAGLILQ